MIATNNSQLRQSTASAFPEAEIGTHRKTSSMAKSYDSNAPPINKKLQALQEMIKDQYHLLDVEYL